MIAYALLGLAVLLLGHFAGPLLARQAWPRRHPGPAIALWLGMLSGSVTACLGLVALAVFTAPGPGHAVVEWILRCVAGHTHTGTFGAILLSLPLVAALVIGLHSATRRFLTTLTARRHHQQMLRLVAQSHDDLDDACVLDHPVPIAYCLPSREQPIVLSSGALEVLEPHQLAAVLDHERAHLRGRHHLILALVDALACAVPWAATPVHARAALAPLLEQAADDAAAGRHGRAAVAGALRSLAITPCPAGALGAATGAEAVAIRLERLEHPDGLPSGRQLAWTGAAISLLVPLTISTGWLTVIALSC